MDNNLIPIGEVLVYEDNESNEYIMNKAGRILKSKSIKEIIEVLNSVYADGFEDGQNE